MISSYNGKVYNFSYQRIKNLFEAYSSSSSDNYSKAYAAWIRPLDYLSLTTSDVQGFIERAAPLDYKELCDERQEIFLTVDFDSKEVVGHEGRHRMAALHKAGAELVAIAVRAYGEKGKYNREFIDSVTVTGQEFMFTRPARKAPGVVSLKALMPISKAEKSHVRDIFGPALVLGTFDKKQIYAGEDLSASGGLRHIGAVRGFSEHGLYPKTIPHVSCPYEINYVHLRKDGKSGAEQDIVIPVSEFMDMIHDGGYRVLEKEPAVGLGDLIAAADAAARREGACAKAPAEYVRD